MKSSLLSTITFVLLLFLTPFTLDTVHASSELYYDEPAGRWAEALPIDNGRLGAMVFGHPEKERIQLNEDTLWAGQPYQAARDVRKDTLKNIQQLIFEGQYKQAQKHLLGDPAREMAYQTLGDLRLTFPGGQEAVESYRRSLDLKTGSRPFVTVVEA